MRLRHLLAAALVVCVAAGVAGAQSFQGGLRGTVRDAQGVIPGVTVTLVNEENGVARDTLSNDAGEYSFPGVVPGIYTVRSSLTGFKRFERNGARMKIGDAAGPYNCKANVLCHDGIRIPRTVVYV